MYQCSTVRARRKRRRRDALPAQSKVIGDVRGNRASAPAYGGRPQGLVAFSTAFGCGIKAKAQTEPARWNGNKLLRQGKDVSASCSLTLAAFPEIGAKATALQTLARWPGILELRQSSWTAPAKPRGDGAFAWHERLNIDTRLTQSGVALRFAPALQDAPAPARRLQTSRSVWTAARSSPLSLGARVGDPQQLRKPSAVGST